MINTAFNSVTDASGWNNQYNKIMLVYETVVYDDINEYIIYAVNENVSDDINVYVFYLFI